MNSIFNHIHAISRNIQNTVQSTAFKTSHKTHTCTHTHTANNVNIYIYNKRLIVHIANILSISSSRKTYVCIYIMQNYQHRRHNSSPILLMKIWSVKNLIHILILSMYHSIVWICNIPALPNFCIC